MPEATTGMSLTQVIAKLYPIMLALANTSLGIGLYAIDALLFAALMWTSGTLVLVGFISSIVPGLIPRLEAPRDVSRRHPR